MTYIPDEAVQVAMDAYWKNIDTKHPNPREAVKDAITAALPYLSAPCAVEVPEGWQLVPKDPTFEMAKAAIDLDPKSDLDAKYKAMLSAAPQVVTKPVDVAAVRRQAFEEAACIADYGMLVPPDGGSPTKAETDVALNIATAIRALSAEPA